ncbi:unnamed protein product [Parnassius apollo]|uniref:(apollo) hypothetical protein n=1 Tax=Parnassius apollo TaxID=110799 RepID=A0A8S3W2V6_PARAO|nr:unnamed protein product [Parnassius apollo]
MLSVLIILCLVPTFINAWRTTNENRRPTTDGAKNIHIHSKRHMLQNENETKRKTSTQRSRDIRKKPSGHLKPLEEDDIENDEVVSVAIGPPAIRPKYEKAVWKQTPRSNHSSTNNNTSGTRLVKEVLIQLGREFLTHQVNEDFVFGQYIGNAMRNLRSDLRLRMQHEVLELVVKYQKLNRGETLKQEEHGIPEEKVGALREGKTEKKSSCSNDTDESWPDFSNFAKIVG